jgi:hypothetical protein
MAISSDMNEILASGLPFWEPILSLTATWALMRLRHHQAAFWMASYGIIVLCCKTSSPTSLTAITSHALAWAHILTSWTAKITILTLICLIFEGPAIRHSASLRRDARRYLAHAEILHARDTRRLHEGCLKLAIIYQAAAITLGMFWAFDDPAWGALWQWDFVEITALLTWICLASWHFNPKRAHLWSIITLAIIYFQSITLYGISNISQISRHAYTNINSAYTWTLFLSLWAILLCIWGIYRSNLISQTLVSQPPTAPKSHTLYESVIYPAFAATVILSGLLPQTAHSQWINLDAQAPYRLEGIRAQHINNCLHYDIEISTTETYAKLPMMACPHEISPLAHADVWTKFSKVRLWALQYRADKGAEILIRPITLDFIIQCILTLLCLCFLTSNRTTKVKLRQSHKATTKS